MDLSLHTYIENIRGKCDDKYLDILIKRATPVANKGLPIIFTTGHFCDQAGIDFHLFYRAINRKIDPYKIFYIRKKSGGFRVIAAPEPFVVKAQKWINERILKTRHAQSLITSYSTAYSPGNNHVKNARVHCSAKWLIKIDITNFFESISERQVFKSFRELGYTRDISFVLSRICTRAVPYEKDIRVKKKIKRWIEKKNYKYLSQSQGDNINGAVGHLPQGASTSPNLSNLVMINIDNKISKISMQNNLMYTRYADDITISGDIRSIDNALKIVKEIRLILGEFGFRVNTQKTRISKPGSRKIVTGLSVDGKSPKIKKEYKDLVRQELHYISKYGLDNHCEKIGIKNKYNYLSRLYGKILYIKFIEPEIGLRYFCKFETLFPNFELLKL